MWLRYFSLSESPKCGPSPVQPSMVFATISSGCGMFCGAELRAKGTQPDAGAASAPAMRLSVMPPPMGFMSPQCSPVLSGRRSSPPSAPRMSTPAVMPGAMPASSPPMSMRPSRPSIMGTHSFGSVAESSQRQMLLPSGELAAGQSGPVVPQVMPSSIGLRRSSRRESTGKS